MHKNFIIIQQIKQGFYLIKNQKLSIEQLTFKKPNGKSI